jgi:hypothetical protein
MHITIFFDPQSLLAHVDKFSVSITAGVHTTVNYKTFTHEKGKSTHYVTMPVLDGYSGLYAGSPQMDTLNINSDKAQITSIILTGNKKEGGIGLPMNANVPVFIPFLERNHYVSVRSRREINHEYLYNLMYYLGGSCVMRYADANL